MTTLKFILLSFIGIIANFSTYAHSSAPIVRSNVHKEWVYIIKCNELQANQYSKFEKLLAKSTVMKQSEDEIILLVSQSVIDSFNLSDCGCTTQKSMPLFRSIASNDDVQAKTELIATQINENDSMLVLKLFFNRHPNDLYSTLIPMHAASMTLLPEFDQPAFDFKLFETLD